MSDRKNNDNTTVNGDDKLRAFVRRFAGFGFYQWPENYSYNDDQAEDAFVTFNQMIETARELMPDVEPGEPITGGQSLQKREGWYIPGIS